jgi:hypothetical protein
MPLPDCFCWTRFGTEAGQLAEQILLRKEQERAANGGCFFWGIGNAIGPSMFELLRRTEAPQVVFSPIRSVPRRDDAMPSSVVAWTEAQTLSGEAYQLPAHSLITSRWDTSRPRAKHYALVCYSEIPIKTGGPSERIQFAGLRNLLTGRPVGASQVTSVVCLNPTAPGEKGLSYEVAFRAQLMPPYFVVLQTPAPLARSKDGRPWAEIVRRTWDFKRDTISLRS